MTLTAALRIHVLLPLLLATQVYALTTTEETPLFHNAAINRE